MRLEDFGDYFRLRERVSNPLEVVRFRKGQRAGDTLAVRMKQGPPLYLRGGCADFHMFHRIFLRDEYRIREVGEKAWRCVVDIGANAGIFARRASELAERVVSCEPVPAHFEQLERNTGGCKGVVALPVAIAGAPGRLKLYRSIYPGLTGTNSVFGEHSELLSEDYDEAEAITLDALFDTQQIEGCDLLKIDVEGSEYGILYGARPETLARVKRIHGEYHDVEPEDARTRIANFRDFLGAQGYSVEVLPHRRKPNHGMFFAQRRSAGP